MNNEQFRRLLADNASKGDSNSRTGSGGTPSRRDGGQGGATPGPMLGSRMRSSIPMTPRSVTGVDFARQLAEHRRETDQPPSKRFKSSAAPKGTKLPSGYKDRAQQRLASDDDGEDIEKRIKALEEMVKLGQIDQGTFEKLRTELGVGGDTKSTHMVKGLDWALLKRVRAGEDTSKAAEKPKVEEPEPIGDVDDEFERLLEEQGDNVLPAAPKEKKEKKGNMAPPPAPAQKRSRDEILKQLKASRAAAAAQASQLPPPPESELGGRFKRIGESRVEKKRFVEQDEKGRRREVLVITDAEGKTKRKTRWLDKPGESNGVPVGLLVPDKDAKPLGMEVPAEIAAKMAAPAPEEEDDDIFAGVGADYDPLAGIGDDSSSDDSDEDGEVSEAKSKATEKPSSISEGKKPADEQPRSSRPHNYFSTSTGADAGTDATEESEDRSNPLTKDPTILAALKRAAALRQASPSGEAEGGEDVDPDSLSRQRKFLEEARRRDAMDAMDMDMGFGGSRNEDEEDEEAVILEGRGGNKRKRGPKKRKGDKDSAGDVMSVLEGRKKE